MLRSIASCRVPRMSAASWRATPSRRCFSMKARKPGAAAETTIATTASTMAASTSVTPRSARDVCIGFSLRFGAMHCTNRLTRPRPHEVGNGAPSGGRDLDVADELAELVDVLEAAIDGREAHVGDLVDALQLAHHQLAQLRRRHFLRAAVEQLVLDALHRGVDLLDAHRPLAQREGHGAADLGQVELGPCAVLLHHRRQRDLGTLVGGEALVAALAAAAPAHYVAFIGLAGLDDLRVFVAAERATHVSLPRRAIG